MSVRSSRQFASEVINAQTDGAVVKNLESGSLNIELSKVNNNGPASYADQNLASMRSKFSQDPKGTTASTAMQVGYPGEGSVTSTRRGPAQPESASDKALDQMIEQAN